MIQIFGIPNCNSVKKTRDWLTKAQIPYEFIDFKKKPPTTDLITQWLDQIPLEILLNRKGTTWRQLTDEQKSAASDPKMAVALMIEFPSVIKRPVVIAPDVAYVGHDEGQLSKLQSRCP